ncbi:hypothetical protein B0T19DRAFT_157110 [Cercophora scortea]|uniref:Uncharacterized protein n=1 Tax=Cercophora scortea TaxID=314031 RepID=A0AAE0ILA4_9PEZI|nr:hypothetical protein B0T19DRAFT_157110 [Cercophora scortea]
MPGHATAFVSTCTASQPATCNAVAQVVHDVARCLRSTQGGKGQVISYSTLLAAVYGLLMATYYVPACLPWARGLQLCNQRRRRLLFLASANVKWKECACSVRMPGRPGGWAIAGFLQQHIASSLSSPLHPPQSTDRKALRLTGSENPPCEVCFLIVFPVII